MDKYYGIHIVNIKTNGAKMINPIIEQIENIDPKFKKLIALNQSQTAAVIGVSPSTLEGWRKKSIGPNYLKMGKSEKKGRILYPKTEIALWLVSHLVKTV